MNSLWMCNFAALHLYDGSVLAYVEAINKEKAKIHMECYL